MLERKQPRSVSIRAQLQGKTARYLNEKAGQTGSRPHDRQLLQTGATARSHQSRWVALKLEIKAFSGSTVDRFGI
jgi:hypothetical protein